MKLGETKSLSVFDDHHRGFGYVDTNLDNRRCDEQSRPSRPEISQCGIALIRWQLAMGEANTISEPLPQFFEAFLNSDCVPDRAFAYEAADPVNLRPLVELPFNALQHGLESAKGVQRGSNALPARQTVR